MRKIYFLLVFALFILSCAQKQEIKLGITSPAIEISGKLAVRYTCDGEKINPPLGISDIPPQAISLALIVDDPDAPAGAVTHWVVWNIPPGNIGENSVPGIMGVNSAGEKRYSPPCPPSGTHRYFFRVYAIDTMLNISSDSKKSDAEKAMEGHIVAKGELVGLYSKS